MFGVYSTTVNAYCKLSKMFGAKRHCCIVIWNYRFPNMAYVRELRLVARLLIVEWIFVDVSYYKKISNLKGLGFSFIDDYLKTV